MKRNDKEGGKEAKMKRGKEKNGKKDCPSGSRGWGRGRVLVKKGEGRF